MSLALHPDIGVTGANVAPEFGLIETCALLEMAALEEESIASGWNPPAGASGFEKAISAEVKAHAPWRKWVPSGMKKADPETLFADAVTARAIVQTCGHYTFYDAKVAESIGKLYVNMGSLWGTGKASEHVISRIKESIRRYVKPFNMTGANAMISIASNRPEELKEA